MSLKIICGRAGSGKSTYMLNDMAESENSIYIVPEQFSFSAEKMIIEKFGMVGLGNPQVLSFMRLADSVFSKYGSPEFISDSASYEMLVSY
jgi:ATP-dependent helicase/nuclease subunit B